MVKVQDGEAMRFTEGRVSKSRQGEAFAQLKPFGRARVKLLPPFLKASKSCENPNGPCQCSLRA